MVNQAPGVPDGPGGGPSGPCQCVNTENTGVVAACNPAGGDLGCLCRPAPRMCIN